jgi:hypothetical protein
MPAKPMMITKKMRKRGIGVLYAMETCITLIEVKDAAARSLCTAETAKPPVTRPTALPFLHTGVSNLSCLMPSPTEAAYARAPSLSRAFFWRLCAMRAAGR